VTEADVVFERARWGDVGAFASWMALVERPVRGSLRRFARAIDVESALQETFLRVWVARRNPKRSFLGDNASVRFALGVARNVALEEVRRARLDHLVPLDDLAAADEPSMDPAPRSDPGLLRAIKACVERLRGKPRDALLARLARGHELLDREIASSLGMAVNTFLQNIVRARKDVAACLERKGL
jgi:DNA-directed RNA polymerase specialized sigma24 family protein